MVMNTYKATMGRSLATTTWILSASLVTGSAIGIIFGFWPIAIPLLAVVVCIAPFSIKSYSITSNAILIHRLFWTTRLEITGLNSVYADPNSMRKSIRTGGADGLFVTLGYYTNKTLGDYHAYVTDPNNAVVLKLPFETVVLSPSEPELFANELRKQCVCA